MHYVYTTKHSNPQVYPDTVRNLMDSYNYVYLLPGNGTGNSPIATAVWNDFSFDDNDTTSTTTPTYVSVQLCLLGMFYPTKYSSGSTEVEEYVDFSQVFVDGEEKEQLKTTDFSLNTSEKTSTPPLTTTMLQYL